MTRKKVPPLRKGKPLLERQYLTTGEISRILNTSAGTISKWVKKGYMPGAYQIPGSRDRRIPISTMARFCSQYGIPLPPELQREPILILVGDLTPDLAPLGYRVDRYATAIDAVVAVTDLFRTTQLVVGETIPYIDAVTLCYHLPQGNPVPIVLASPDVIGTRDPPKGVILRDPYTNPINWYEIVRELIQFRFVPTILPTSTVSVKTPIDPNGEQSCT